MGKTTLAKVLANHCKYEPIVINASDERTSDKLLLRIYDTTQLDKLKFKKNLGDREKPTCLILDEIDGAMDGQDGKVIILKIFFN
jgi:chromosome transmission fidelity protein 18